jgi:hypothetical protein
MRLGALGAVSSRRQQCDADKENLRVLCGGGHNQIGQQLQEDWLRQLMDRVNRYQLSLAEAEYLH